MLMTTYLMMMLARTILLKVSMKPLYWTRFSSDSFDRMIYCSFSMNPLR